MYSEIHVEISLEIEDSVVAKNWKFFWSIKNWPK